MPFPPRRGFTPHRKQKDPPKEGLLSHNLIYALIIPLRMAYRTNSDRECRLNFRMMFSR